MPFRSAVSFLICALIVALGCQRSSHDDREPVSSATTPSSQKQWLKDVTDEVGVTFVHETGASGKLYMPEIMCGGLAVFDYDLDGRLDLYFVNGHKGLPDPRPYPGSPNRMYHQKTDGTWEDVTSSSGLDDTGYGMGVAIGDMDNDGLMDVYVTNYGADAFYRNRGDGTFENVTRRAGINVGGWSTSATFLDYDRDGYLDLYVARYLEFNPLQRCYDAAGREDYCGPKTFHSVPDVLLHNNGNGTFTDVSEREGIAALTGAGLGVVAADFNDDGWIDIYVANDGDPNFLWINQGALEGPRFQEQAMSWGAAFSINGTAEASMGIISPDLDNDGDFDLFLTHLDGETNTAYLNLGSKIGFIDMTAETGLGRESLPLTGFGVAAVDVELDGDLDVFVVNGRVLRGKRHSLNLLPPSWDSFAEPKLLYSNDGEGHFTYEREIAGDFVNSVEVSRALAAADIDADGDLDLVVVNAQARARVFRNVAPRKGAWLVVRAWDPRLNRDALGASVRVKFGDKIQARTIQANESYLTAVEPVAAFGIRDNVNSGQILVRWPDGLTEEFGEVRGNHRVTVVRGTGKEIQPMNSAPGDAH